MPKQGMYITEQSRHGISLDCLRLTRWREPSQVGSYHHVVSAKLGELACVDPPGVWGTMQKQHELAFSFLDKVQLHFVAVGVALHRTGLTCARVRPDGHRSESR